MSRVARQFFWLDFQYNSELELIFLLTPYSIAESKINSSWYIMTTEYPEYREEYDYDEAYYPDELYVESIVGAIAYSYKIDPESPNFTDKAARIFTVTKDVPDLATVTAQPELIMKTNYRESEDTSDQCIGGSASVFNKIKSHSFYY